MSEHSYLPRMMIECRLDRVESYCNNTIMYDSPLRLNVNNYNYQISEFRNDRFHLFIIGHPIVGDKIDQGKIWHELNMEGKLSKFFIKNLNGEFLIAAFDVEKKILVVSNDRFASIPVYYAIVKNKFIASQFYNDIWKILRDQDKFELNVDAFFEFLYLQRLLGTKTYDKTSSFMPAACSLVCCEKKITIDKYWLPSFNKTTDSINVSAVKLVEGLKKSIDRKISDSDGHVRKGLFLSGGLDSRTILSAFYEPPTCFTLAVAKNNEYKVAHEVASVRNSEHIYIQIDPDPYSMNLDALVQLGGGMYAFDHALFYGFKSIVSSSVDLMFHGHGLDYMFQGMYLPSVPIYIGKYRTFFNKHRSIGADFAEDYLANIPHRLKGINLLDFVKVPYRNDMFDGLKASVDEIAESGKAFCNTPDDTWEYMLNHAISRHYPYTNLSSMSTCTEQRTITFDNDLFDLYLSLPFSHRNNANIARLALKKLNPSLSKIRSGNTNVRADFSPFQKQTYKLLDKGLCITGLRDHTAFHAPAEERTWPDRDRLIRNQPAIRQAAIDLCRSEALNSLGFLDMDVIGKQIPRWLEQPYGGGAFMIFLITLDRFIKQ